MFRKIFDFIIDSIQAVVFALSIFVLGYLFIAQPNKIKGTSMLPTFEDSEMLIVEKISYRLDTPERGDVVVFKAPESEACSEDQCEYIKRVIALPGDEIMVLDGKIYINSNVLSEDYLDISVKTDPGSFLTEGESYEVPGGYYMLMGDNRPHSRDSREFGPILKEDIVGKAFVRYWPPEKFGLVNN
jgi:signal peptidase I